jgi:hypothetical protein
MEKEAPEDKEEICSNSPRNVSGVESREADEGVGRVGHSSTDVELVERTGQVSISDGDEEDESRKPKRTDVWTGSSGQSCV